MRGEGSEQRQKYTVAVIKTVKVGCLLCEGG